MNDFLYTFLIIFGVFAISFVLINIRHIVTGKEFRGTCATNNPYLKSNVGECSVCGKAPEEECKMPELNKNQA
jgi:hypothetical protein